MNASASRPSLLALALLGGSALTAPALAAGVPVAPVNTNTQAALSANGTPTVNIAAPNAAGLSHNQYTGFSVDSRGLVLNNGGAAQTSWASVLAGRVAANPNLAQSGPATVILNEVVSPNVSTLAGYVEVAGQKADVIVANPYGVTVDGAGFINTHQATLTTGAPVIGADGSLSGFKVNGGQIAIQGQGLDGSQTDYLALISRAISLQGQVNAHALDVVAGVGSWNYATQTFTAAKGDANAPTLAIDSSALGGMYADRIRLIVTEAGVGVRLLGGVAANSGALTITADGAITVGGPLSAAATLTAASQSGAITLADAVLTSGGDLDLSAPKGALSFTGGVLSAGGALNLTGASLADAGDSSTLANNNARYGALGVTLGLSGAARLDAVAYASGAGLQGALGALSVGPDGATLSAGDGALRLAAGAGDLALATGVVLASGDVGLSASGTVSTLASATGGVESTGGGVTIAGALSNGGIILAKGGPLTVQGDAITDAGKLESVGAVSLSDAKGGATEALGISGQVLGDGAVTLQGAQVTVASGGLVQGGGGVSVAAASLDNAGAIVVPAAAGGAGPLLQIASGALTNAAGGEINGAGAVDLTASGPIADAGQLVSGGAMTLAGAAPTQALAVTVGPTGQVQAGGAFTLSGAKDTLDVQGGASGAGQLLAGSATLTLARLSVEGVLQSSGALAIGDSGALSVTGRVLAGAGLTLTAGATVNSGVIASNSAAVPSSQVTSLTLASLNNSGQILIGDAPGAASSLAVTGLLQNAAGAVIQSGGGLTLTSGVAGAAGATAPVLAILNQGSILAEGGDLTLALNDLGNPLDIENTSAKAYLQASGAVTVSAPDAVLQNGGVIDGAAVSLNLQSLQNQRVAAIQSNTGAVNLAVAQPLTNAGTILSTGAMSLSAPTVTNPGTLQAGTGLTLTAQSLDDAGVLIGSLASGARSVLQLQTLKVEAGGSLQYAGDLRLNLTGGDFVDQGKILATGELDVDGGRQTGVDLQQGAVLQAGGDLDVNLSQPLTLASRAELIAGGRGQLQVASLTNAGTISSGKDLDLSSRGAATNSGAIYAGGMLDLSASSLDNSGGAPNPTTGAATAGGLQAIGGGKLSLQGAFTNEGLVVFGDPAGGAASGQVAAASLANAAGATLYATGALDLASPGALSNFGQVLAGRALKLGVTGVDNEASGLLQAGGVLTYAGAFSTQAGTVAGDTLALTTPGNFTNTGTLQATSAGSVLTIGGQFDNTRTGTVILATTAPAAGAATAASQINATNLDNAGSLQSAGVLNLRLGVYGGPQSSFDNTGSVLALGDLNLTSVADMVVKSSGSLQTGGSLQIYSPVAGIVVDVSLPGGALASNSLYIQANALDFGPGASATVKVGDAFDLNVLSGGLDFGGQLLSYGSDPSTIQLDGSAPNFVNHGLVYGAGGLTINAGSAYNMAGASLASGGALSITVGGAAGIRNEGAVYALGALALTSYNGDISNGQLNADNSQVLMQGGDGSSFTTRQTFANYSTIESTGSLSISAPTFINDIAVTPVAVWGGAPAPSGTDTALYLGAVHLPYGGTTFISYPATDVRDQLLLPTTSRAGDAASFFNSNAAYGYSSAWFDLASRQDGFKEVQNNEVVDYNGPGGSISLDTTYYTDTLSVTQHWASTPAPSAYISAAGTLTISTTTGEMKGGVAQAAAIDLVALPPNGPGPAPSFAITNYQLLQDNLTATYDNQTDPGNYSVTHDQANLTYTETAVSGVPAGLVAGTLSAGGFNVTLGGCASCTAPMLGQAPTGGSAAGVGALTGVMKTTTAAGGLAAASPVPTLTSLTGGAAQAAAGGATLASASVKPVSPASIGLQVSLPTSPNGFYVVNSNPDSRYLVESNPLYTSESQYNDSTGSTTTGSPSTGSTTSATGSGSPSTGVPTTGSGSTASTGPTTTTTATGGGSPSTGAPTTGSGSTASTGSTTATGAKSSSGSTSTTSSTPATTSTAGSGPSTSTSSAPSSTASSGSSGVSAGAGGTLQTSTASTTSTSVASETSTTAAQQAGSTAAGAGSDSSTSVASNPSSGTTSASSPSSTGATSSGSTSAPSSTASGLPTTPVDSDYLAMLLGYNPDQLEQRLGDGAYEQQLISQQLVSQTGSAQIYSQDTTAQQTRVLYNQAASQARTLGLTYGEPLTDAQQASLTSDMVWMVSTVVQGHVVLTPVVYLSEATQQAFDTGAPTIRANDANLQLASLTSNGGAVIATDTLTLNTTGALQNNSGLIQAVNLNLSTAQNLTNNGAISSQNGLVASAGSVTNNGLITGGQTGAIAVEGVGDVTNSASGRITGANTVVISQTGAVNNNGGLIVGSDTLGIKAQTSLNNTSGQIRGGDVQLQAVTGDINNTTASNTTTAANGDASTSFGAQAGISATGALAAKAAGDINITDATVSSGGDTSLVAGRNINVGALDDHEQSSSSGGSSNFFSSSSSHTTNTSDTLHGSTVQAGGQLYAQAGQDVNVNASNVKVGGLADIVANGDVNITAGQNSDTATTTTKSSNWFGSSSKTTSDTTTSNVASNLSAGQLMVSAGGGQAGKGDVNIVGSNVSVAGDGEIQAGHDVNIVAGQNTHATSEKSSQSGLGVGDALYGDIQETKTSNDTVNVASNVTGGGALVINAGHDANVVGSNLSANGGGIQAVNDINIVAGRNTHSDSDTRVSNTVLGVSGTGSASASANASADYSGSANANIGALQAGASSSGGAGAGADTAQGYTTTASNSAGAGVNGANPAGTTGVVGAGASASGTASAGAQAELDASGGVALYNNTVTHSDHSSTTAVGSNVAFGQNGALVAGNDVNVVGSNLSAGGQLGISANNINITTAKNTQASNASAMSTTIGVQTDSQNTVQTSVGANAAGSASASGSYGSGSGSGSVSAGLNAGINGASNNDVDLARNTQSSASQSAVTNTGSNVSGGSVVMIAKNALNVTGSNLSSTGDMALQATDMTFGAAQNTTHQSDASRTTGVGFYGDTSGQAQASASVGAGAGVAAGAGTPTAGANASANAGASAQADGGVGVQVHNAMSTDSNDTSTAQTTNLNVGGTLTRVASNSITDIGTQIATGGDLDQSAKTFNSLAAANTTSSTAMNNSETVRLGAYGDAGASAQAGAGAGAGSGSNSAAGPGGNAPNASAGAGAGAEGGLGDSVSASGGYSQGATSTAVTSNYGAGGKVNMYTSGTATLKGSNIGAGGGVNLYADTLNDKAAHNTSSALGTQQSYTSQANVGVDAESVVGGGAQANYTGQEGASRSSQAVTGAIVSNGPVNIQIAHDATFEGTQIASAGDVNMNVGGDLNYNAAADTAQAIGGSQTMQAGLTFSGKTMGVNGQLGVQAGAQQSSTAEVGGVSAGGNTNIYAGKSATFQGTQLASNGSTAIEAQGPVSFNAAQSTSQDLSAGFNVGGSVASSAQKVDNTPTQANGQPAANPTPASSWTSAATPSSTTRTGSTTIGANRTQLPGGGAGDAATQATKPTNVAANATKANGATSTSSTLSGDVGVNGQYDQSNTATAASIAAGGGVSVKSDGGDVNLRGTQVAAAGPVQIAAARDVNFTTADSSSVSAGGAFGVNLGGTVNTGVQPAKTPATPTASKPSTPPAADPGAKDAALSGGGAGSLATKTAAATPPQGGVSGGVDSGGGSASVDAGYSSTQQGVGLSGGSVSVSAGRDLNATGGSITSTSGDTTLNAARNMNLGAATNAGFSVAASGSLGSGGDNSNSFGGGSLSAGGGTTGMSISSAGNTTLNAGGKATLAGTQVASNEATTLNAVGGVSRSSTGGAQVDLGSSQMDAGASVQGVSLGGTKVATNTGATAAKAIAGQGAPSQPAPVVRVQVGQPVQVAAPGSTVQVTTSSGQPAPSWVTYNPKSGTVTASPPAGYTGPLSFTLNVVGTDGTVTPTTLDLSTPQTSAPSTTFGSQAGTTKTVSASWTYKPATPTATPPAPTPPPPTK